MKLLIFTLVLLLSGTESFAMNAGSVRTKVVCEAGYTFLIVWSSQGTAPAVTQIWEVPTKAGRPALPMTCNQ